jgi:hypothetical protein
VTARPTSSVMSLRLCGACLLAVLALVAAGCGGSSSPTAVLEPISFEQLAQSASTSADATSGRFSFDLSLTFPGGDEPFAFSGEGAFDEASGRASFAVDMSSFAKLLGGFVAGLGGANTSGLPDFDDRAGWRIDVVQDGTVGYVRFPALDGQLPAGKTWIRGDADSASTSGFDFGELEQFAKSDPRDVLGALRAVTSEVETVGSEQLRGVETTHYRATVDPAELAKLASGKDRAGTQSLVDRLSTQAGFGSVPVDVWLDASGLVRKLSLSVEATEPSTSRSSEVSMSFELWDYGRAVDIELPPASQVVDASTLHS